MSHTACTQPWEATTTGSGRSLWLRSKIKGQVELELHWMELRITFMSSCGKRSRNDVRIVIFSTRWRTCTQRHPFSSNYRDKIPTRSGCCQCQCAGDCDDWGCIRHAFKLPSRFLGLLYSRKTRHVPYLPYPGSIIKESRSSSVICSWAT